MILALAVLLAANANQCSLSRSRVMNLGFFKAQVSAYAQNQGADEAYNKSLQGTFDLLTVFAAAKKSA